MPKRYESAVMQTKFPLRETFQGRVTVPGQLNVLYHRQTGDLGDVNSRLGRKYVKTNELLFGHSSPMPLSQTVPIIHGSQVKRGLVSSVFNSWKDLTFVA